MPLGQFDERRILVGTDFLDDTFAAATYFSTFTATNGDLRIDQFQIANNDTIPHTVWIAPLFGADSSRIAIIDVPAGAGSGSVPPVDALAFISPTAFHYFVLAQGQHLYWAVGEAINAGKQIVNYTTGGYF